MSTVSRGSAFENQIAGSLEESGFTVASRRHRGGVGDLLAVHHDGRRWLVECKTTARSAMADYGPAKRKEARAYCRRHGLSMWLVWRAPGKAVTWLHESTWPGENKGEK